MYMHADEEIIEKVFGAQKPEHRIVKEYGSPHRIFPYCIYNSIDEAHISWTYTNTEGRVYERAELFTTVVSVSYQRYYPWELTLLSIKVGSDGTAGTGNETSRILQLWWAW